MSQKIVINADYGGFCISIEAARFMAARGSAMAMTELTEYEAKLENVSQRSEIEHKIGVSFYGYGANGKEYPRDDPALIAAVEELGSQASGNCATLKVVEIPDGVDWEIGEYDGREWVSEKHRRWR